MPWCPPGHTAYPSEQVATNVVELHRIAHVHCGGFEAWPCGDHWHVGHPSAAVGQACKSDPGHRSRRARLAAARRDAFGLFSTRR